MLQPKKVIVKVKKKIPVDRVREVADSLTNSSNSKADFAYTQERMGSIQIKNKVKEGSMEYRGSILPVGQERIDIANKAKKEAVRDESNARRYNALADQAEKKSKNK